MNIKRQVLTQFLAKIQENKVMLLYGPRRTGKTTLLKNVSTYLEKTEKIKFVNGELTNIQDELSSKSLESLKNFIAGNTLLIIDEAQKIPEIGLVLKIIVDNIFGVKIIASGSASLALSQEVGEPLTGRQKITHLFPISAKEIIDFKDELYYKENLENYLIFGTYPEIFHLHSRNEKIEYLSELVNSFLFRDILELERIKNSKKLKDLLTLLAFQIGKEVSLSELANTLDMHIETVSRYLDLMEKSFIIINIRGFSRNLRKEVSKTSRYYFYDLGIRNAVINNFNKLKLRNDLGALWENYIIIERIKKQNYTPIFSNNYFWRTYDKKEIDFVEEREGKLYGFEIKWSSKKVKEPALWKAVYQEAEFKVIDRDNFLPFIV